MLLARLANRFITSGTLRLIDADGRTHVFGDGTGRPVAVRLHDRSLHHKIYFNPELYIGEAYMDGTLTVEEGGVYDLLDLGARNAWREGARTTAAVWVDGLNRLLRPLHQFNPLPRARATEHRLCA